jgi:hypothetical protein
MFVSQCDTCMGTEPTVIPNVPPQDWWLVAAGPEITKISQLMGSIGMDLKLFCSPRCAGTFFLVEQAAKESNA